MPRELFFDYETFPFRARADSPRAVCMASPGDEPVRLTTPEDAAEQIRAALYDPRPS